MISSDFIVKKLFKSVSLLMTNLEYSQKWKSLQSPGLCSHLQDNALDTLVHGLNNIVDVNEILHGFIIADKRSATQGFRQRQ